MAQMLQELIISHDSGAAGDLSNDLYAETGYRELAAEKIVKYLKDVVDGARPAAVKTRTNAVRASGTVTLASFVADDTVTIGGTVFTGKASPSGQAQFACGVTDTADAAALAAKINAHTTVSTQVYATSALGVVTLVALDPGALGNGFSIAISAHGSVSAAYLANGTNGSTETIHYFGSTAVTGLSNF